MSRNSKQSSEPITRQQREILFDESLIQLSDTRLPGSYYVKNPMNNCYQQEEIIFDFEEDFYRNNNEDGKIKLDVSVPSSKYEEVYRFIA